LRDAIETRLSPDSRQFVALDRRKACSLITGNASDDIGRERYLSYRNNKEIWR